MGSNNPAVAYHHVRWDDELGDFKVLEYDEHDALLTWTVMHHPRGGEPGELIRFASDGAEIQRKTYIDPVDDTRVRVIAGEHAGESGKLGVAIRNEHTGEIRQRVDIVVEVNRTRSIFVDPSEVEQLD